VEDYSTDRQEEGRSRGGGTTWPQGSTGSQRKRRGRFDRPVEDFTAIPNHVLLSLCSRALTDWEKSIALAICRRTYGWADRRGGITVSWLAKVTGIAERHVRETLSNLETAHVLIHRTAWRRGKSLDLWIEEDTFLWDVGKLKKLRSRARPGTGDASEAAKGLEEGCGRESEPRPESVLPVRTENVLGSAHGIRAPLNKGNKSINKSNAAGAAVSFSQSEEGENGRLLGSSDNDKSTGSLNPISTPAGPTREEQLRVVRLCEELEDAGKDPYVWLGKRHREGVPFRVLIEVLEEAVKQKDRIRDFEPWADKVLESIRERERDEEMEREQEAFKREEREVAPAIVKQVFERVAEEKARAGVSAGPASPDGEVKQ
jgi:phage replication O-like protein O